MLLKVVPASMITRGFAWPKKGQVECPDWKPTKACGNGLHAWRWTPGCNPGLSYYIGQEGAKWLLVQVAECDIVDLGDKVKFSRGTVVYCGKFETAIRRLQKDKSRAGFNGTATAGDRGTATAGYGGTATAGYGGTATAGYRGTATAGYGGTATAGFNGTATAGDGGTATAGDGGTATAGYGGTATAGDGGTATAGYGGTATAGFHGTATAGDGGTATAGYRGTATAGYGGTATAGDGGTICILGWDEAKLKYRRLIAEVGETPGIEAGKKYRVEAGAFIESI